ncbi:hypothetical protein SUGI_0983570 [Cryptomeria japonica]|nr:hypothetical protein SUGI_0983570 [Cryptomeria japonica]
MKKSADAFTYRSYHEQRRGNQNDHARASIDVATRATRARHSETCFLLGVPHTMSTTWLVWWYGSLQFATVSVDTRNEMVCNPFEQVSMAGEHTVDEVERVNMVETAANNSESVWEKTPYHLMEEILEYLPLESVFRFCIVSKEWNSLLSSERFHVPQLERFVLSKGMHAVNVSFARSLGQLPAHIVDDILQMLSQIWWLQTRI